MCFENVFLKCYSNILLALATGYGIFDTKPLLQPVARAQLAESSRSQENTKAQAYFSFHCRC